MANESQNSKRNSEQDMLLIGVFLLLGCAGVVLYFAHTAFGIRQGQMIEFSIVVGALVWLFFEIVSYHSGFAEKYEKLWPKLSVLVPKKNEDEQIAEAAQNNSVLIAHDSSGKPFYWPDSIRTYQAAAYGMTGAGKTTLIMSIVQQDIQRGCPLIYMEGKGDAETVDVILGYAAAAGRLDDVRLIIPTRPEISCRYNPFFAPDGDLDERIGFIIDSFKREQTAEDFFDQHQRTFFINVCRILFHTGRLFSFFDILVAAQDERVLREQIVIARKQAAADRSLSDQARKTLEMSIHNLLLVFEDREWSTKIQGLLNKMMTFVSEALALITGGSDELFTLEDVMDKNLILIMSLNTNVNKQAVTALGRIILQNLQLMIGKKYSQTQRSGPPFMSVVLDEFAEFAYNDFSRIINQARGAGVGFLFSTQSVPQLEAVGRGFADDLSSAPNSKFMLRTQDETTAGGFRDAAGKVQQTRTSVHATKVGFISKTFREESTGTMQEVIDSRVADEQVKILPTGQMMALIVDHKMGSITKHLHIRRPDEFLLLNSSKSKAFHFPHSIYENLRTPKSHSQGINLKFSLPTGESSNDGNRGRKNKKGR